MLQDEPGKRCQHPLTLVSCFNSDLVLFMIWGIFLIFLASILKFSLTVLGV